MKCKWGFRSDDPALDRTPRGIVDNVIAKGDAGLLFLQVKAPEGIRIVQMLKDAEVENTLMGYAIFSDDAFAHGFRELPWERDAPGFYTSAFIKTTKPFQR